GSIFFGACQYIQQLLQRSRGQRLVIDARHINFIDYAGVEMLHQEARRLQALKRSLVLRQARPPVVEEILKLEGAERCPVQFED
ncbi:MAG: sodium-independent anion transporter, partial [Pseudomonas sp.]|nr:sodium-independent anion transporter [Pseudomonas sp.]